MDRPAGSAVNIAAILHSQAPLTAREAVALLHEVCTQVKYGFAAAIPDDPSGLSINDLGMVSIHAGTPEAQAGVTVANLLESLLPPRTSENDAVPDSLRTLSARLRDSTSAKGAELGDLLAILRWHLDDEPQHILQQLAQRLGLADAAPTGDPFIDQFDDSVEPAIPLSPPTAEHHRLRADAQWAIAAAMLLLLCGYAGYRFTAMQRAPRPAAASAAAATAPPMSPRISATARVEPIVNAAPSTAPLPLNISDGTFSPSFSADGGALFFHRGRDRGQLVEATLGDSSRALTTILDDGAHNFHARPSSDGRWIAFDSDREGTRAVYVMDRDGANTRRMSGDGFAAVPSWSPDMRWLAFVRGETARPRVWNLWLRDMASGELRRVSTFPSGQVWSASWFPNGAAICYSHDDQLIVTDFTTGRSRVFATPVRGRLARTPAVSPDGSRVVFQVLGDGVWMLDPSSGAMRRILDDGTAEEFAWDPRGRRLAYHSRRDGRWRIWLMTL